MEGPWAFTTPLQEQGGFAVILVRQPLNNFIYRRLSFSFLVGLTAFSHILANSVDLIKALGGLG